MKKIEKKLKKIFYKYINYIFIKYEMSWKKS